MTGPATLTRSAVAFALCLGLAACGGSASGPSGSLGSASLGSLNPFGGSARTQDTSATRGATRVRGAEQVAVNRYLWAASLDVLSFLPVQSVDPFTGVIDFGFGTPPGGGRAYRATVFVSDPALDARSLNVALQSRGGPVSLETQRAVEDAILSRARQLRIRDGGL